MVSVNVVYEPKRQNWLKKLLLITSPLFIIGGALNDGLTGWLFAIPFIYLIYISLPYPVWKRRLLCLFIILVVITISSLKYTSSLIYPVINQPIKFRSDIPTVTYSSGGSIYYDAFNEIHDQDEIKSSIPRNSTFFVKKIVATHPDFDNQLRFILTDGNQELIVKDYFLTKSAYISSDKENSMAFCKKVEWEFCSKISEDHVDPMSPLFRWLTWLMAYPGAPVYIPMWLLSVNS